MADLILLSPLDGWASSLDETPDAVFAGRMLGDGVLIDPIGETLFAPCAGTVVRAPGASHAVSLRTADGAEVLMHLGLDTVGLNGEGFTVHVADGQTVAAGAPLISFDLELLARRARSLQTPIVVTAPAGVAINPLAAGRIKVGDPLLRISGMEGSGAALSLGGPSVERRLQLTHAHGIHARPGALIAAAVKPFTAEVGIAAGGRSANARSPVALMGLGAAEGSELIVTACGPDADAAISAVAAAVAAINALPVHASAAPAPTPAPATLPDRAGLIRGATAAPGLTLGLAWRLDAHDLPVAETGAGVAEEAAALEGALTTVRASLQARVARLAGEPRAVLEAHLALLDDPGLAADAGRAIVEGASAGAAWRRTLRAEASALEALGDSRLAERALDLKDLERQVLRALAGEAAHAGLAPPRGAVVLADDLAPSDLVGLQAAGIAGLCTARGGPTSHVAIMAAAMDIPALVAAGDPVLAAPEGVTVVLDADAGVLNTTPTTAELEAAQLELARRAAARAATLAAAAEPCRTVDGVRIEVFANVGALAEAELAARNGAEGCGLLRTEFLFLDRESPPGEAEQIEAYQGVAAALPGLPVIIRTLDVGGDKPAPYLSLPVEENPALGVRGVRVSLRQPELLRVQMRAILKVQPAGQCRVMVPMVSSLEELIAARRILGEAAAELGVPPASLGVMIETPAAAVTADLIAAEADFLSIGSNDLAQYALAMDRGNPALAGEVDALHPAVLRLIRLAAQGAARNGKPVAVCGGLASDLAAAPILIGLGVTELSTAPARAPEIKALVRTLHTGACRDLAEQACRLASAAEVRRLTLNPPQGGRP